MSPDSARRGLHGAELAGLLAVAREPGCRLAVSVRDLPEPEAGPDRRPLYGPIPWSWWLPASRLPGKSLQVASACWLLAGWERSAEFELALDGWADLGLSRYSASRGLDALRRAGLVSVAPRPGRSPIVSILDPGSQPDPTTKPGPDRSGEIAEAQGKMGWKRINGREYYYKSEWVGGRVRSAYFGTGELASLVASLDAEAREGREAGRRELRAEREQADAEEREISAWFDGIQAVADGAMRSAGFHKHKGQWRRRRDGGDRSDERTDRPRIDDP
ncbi:MAG: hypothetical protein JOZ63_10375 [Planctomycetaceae bacterium]|nr:hypothetical protein [Planctomycetaceae bacterium]